MDPAFALAMAGAASAHQAATASREQSSQQRTGRTRRTSADPQRAPQWATAAAAAAPAALDSLSRLQQLADASPQVAQLRRLQALADNRFAPVAQLAGGPEEEELVQGKFASAELQPQLQQAPRANNTGLPDQLKSGIESLSGLSMDDVRVHYNSSQPAQLNALAYAQGSDIHLASGQEKHLPHEAWHVVQQAQGRVRPTLQMKDGVQVNDDVGLEHEADLMGAKLIQIMQAQKAKHSPIENWKSFNIARNTKSSPKQLMTETKCTEDIGEYKVIYFGNLNPEKPTAPLKDAAVAHAGIYIPSTEKFYEWGNETSNCSLNKELTDLRKVDTWAYFGQSWIGETKSHGRFSLKALPIFAEYWTKGHSDLIKQNKAQFPNNCRGFVEHTIQFATTTKNGQHITAQRAKIPAKSNGASLPNNIKSGKTSSGRIKPVMQAKGLPINADQRLETENGVTEIVATRSTLHGSTGSKAVGNLPSPVAQRVLIINGKTKTAGDVDKEAGAKGDLANELRRRANAKPSDSYTYESWSDALTALDHEGYKLAPAFPGAHSSSSSTSSPSGVDLKEKETTYLEIVTKDKLIKKRKPIHKDYWVYEGETCIGVLAEQALPKKHKTAITHLVDAKEAKTLGREITPIYQTTENGYIAFEVEVPEDWEILSSVVEKQGNVIRKIEKNVFRLPVSCSTSAEHIIRYASGETIPNWKPNPNNEPTGVSVYGADGKEIQESFDLGKDEIPKDIFYNPTKPAWNVDSKNEQKKRKASPDSPIGLGEGILGYSCEAVKDEEVGDHHAVVVVARNKKSGEIIVVERNAGETTGTSEHSDDKWVLNRYKSPKDFLDKTGMNLGFRLAATARATSSAPR
jgi:hypothetical protein